MRVAGPILLLTALLATACSGGGGSTDATPHGSLNVTPCNYAQAWHDDPAQFVEFSTLANFAGKATNANLRDEGRQLSSAIAAHDTALISQVMSDVFTSCRQLGLVKTSQAHRTTS